MALILKLFTFTLLLRAGMACFAFGRGGGDMIMDDGRVRSKKQLDALTTVNPMAVYQLKEAEINRIIGREGLLRQRFRQCKKCEKEARKKVIKATRCRAVMCNFEMGNTCNYRSGGKPGLPPKLLEVFLKTNPNFENLADPDSIPEMPSTGETYPLASGNWAENIGGPFTDSEKAMLSLLSPEELSALTTGRLTGDQAHTLGRMLAARINAQRKEAAIDEDALTGLAGLLEQAFGGGRKRRAKRQIDMPDMDALNRLFNRLAFASVGRSEAIPLESLGIYVAPGEREAQLLKDKIDSGDEVPDIVKYWGFVPKEKQMSYIPHKRTKRQFPSLPANAFQLPDMDSLNKILNEMNRAAGPATGYLPLESLGVRITPGEREAQLISDQLAGEGLIPTPGQRPRVASGKSWGAINKKFGNTITGINKAPEGDYWGTTYVLPGDNAVMETEVFFTDDDYYVYFDTYETTKDVQLRMCCAGKCTAITPWDEDVDTREWRKMSGVCPRGTRKITFTCQNRGRLQGACGIDNVKLFTKDGINYCEGVDLMAGQGVGQLSKSILDSSSLVDGGIPGAQAQLDTLLAMLERLSQNDQLRNPKRRL